MLAEQVESGTQKLLYLYGFPEIDTTEKGQKFDSETINVLDIKTNMQKISMQSMHLVRPETADDRSGGSI